MSWRDPLSRARRRRIGLGGCAALLTLGLGGCFTPEYLGAGTGGVGDRLRTIAVDGVPDRLGHYLNDELITDLNGTGAAPTPRYHLQLSTAERVQTALVDITSQRAQDATVVTDVTWKLIPVGGVLPVLTGTVTSTATYDRSSQRFANIRAARDAEIRNAKTLADLITTQLSARIGELPAPK